VVRPRVPVGFVIVALEILWVRVMGQVGQFHAYLFPTVLGVFLLADGAASPWLRGWSAAWTTRGPPSSWRRPAASRWPRR
jgi:hypothetical protein